MNTATDTTAETLLSVRGLSVTFRSSARTVNAVRGVDFDLRRGEVLGIVGESGSGKSVTANAIMGLHGENARIRGSIRFDGTELVGASDRAMGELRGRRISMIFQDPMTSLNPTMTIGDQVSEAILIHQRMPKAQARARAAELLTVVGIPNVESRMSSYPHEFSGGMRQRVVIAIAMANEPDIIIADEPTTALDVTVQAQVMNALERARHHVNAALIFVTHDLGLIAGHADRILVMYGGQVVERGTTDDVFTGSRMPYTRGLLAAIPRIDRRGVALVPIPGSPPSPDSLTGTSCAFAPRCQYAAEICSQQEPVLLEVGERDHAAACHFARDTGILVPAERTDSTARGRSERPAVAADGAPLLVIDDVVKSYTVRKRGKTKTVYAVNGVSLQIGAGETLGLVGESGCGKSSLSRSVVRLQSVTSGDVLLDGADLSGARGGTLRRLRNRIQMVFQDPYSSLDPRMTVEAILSEPLRLNGTPRRERAQRVAHLLREVGLSPSMMERYPHEFSGGQRQRLGIARALATDPDVLVLDEPVSALDVSVQAGVINLLEKLKDERRMGYLFIAHDLSVVAHISDRIAVMYLGRIVEIGASEEIFTHPRHPYTRALISAVPLPDPELERSRQVITLQGDLPSPMERIDGCNFRSRCPIYAKLLTPEQRVLCDERTPELAAGDAHPAACHYTHLDEATTKENAA